MEVVDIVKPLTKYAVLLKDKNKIRYELEKCCITQMRAGKVRF